jgi:SOS-response transcriptional repressor LexA
MSIDAKLRNLRAFYRNESRIPSYSEMMELFAYRSKSAVFHLVHRLEEQGIFRRGLNGKLAPGPGLCGSVRRLGVVKAGFPVPAGDEEAEVSMVNLDTFLVENPAESFLLTVDGESMRDAGILPGDSVLVEKGLEAHSGDVVLALVDGEWTLKYLRIEAGQKVLVPANPDFHVLVPQHSLEIGGVVKAVIRKFR